MANNQQNYGFPQPLSQSFPAPIVANRAPTTTDIQYPIGQIWVYESAGHGYILVTAAASVATWKAITS